MVADSQQVHPVECWRHGSRFNLATGAVLNLPAVKPVQVYLVRGAFDLAVRATSPCRPTGHSGDDDSRWVTGLR